MVNAMRLQLAISNERVNALEHRVGDLRETALVGAGAEVTLTQLTHEADAKRSLYQTLLARVEETRMGEGQAPSARIVSPAVAPQKRDGLSIPLMAAIGAFGGFVLAVMLCISGQLFRRGVGSARELVRLTGAPNLGCLPAKRIWLRHSRSSIVDKISGSSAVVETLRGIRISIQNMQPSAAAKVVLVTSSDVGEGKTTFCMSFAQLCAADGIR